MPYRSTEEYASDDEDLEDSATVPVHLVAGRRVLYESCILGELWGRPGISHCKVDGAGAKAGKGLRSIRPALYTLLPYDLLIQIRVKFGRKDRAVDYT